LFEEGFGVISSDSTLFSDELKILLVLSYFRKKDSFLKILLKESQSTNKGRR